MICVSVRSLAANLLELELEAQSDVSCLKHRIAELWRIPPPCQRLLHGAVVLEQDDEKLEDVAAASTCREAETSGYIAESTAAASISLTLLVSLDHLRCDLLENCSREAQTTAFEQLFYLALQGEADNVDEMVAKLRYCAPEDTRVWVRRAAVCALTSLGEWTEDEDDDSDEEEDDVEGNDESEEEDDSSDEQGPQHRLAVSSLIRVVAMGDPSISESKADVEEASGDGAGMSTRLMIDAFQVFTDIALIRHPKDDIQVRCAAVESLGLVSESGEERVIEVVAQCLKDPDHRIRQAALGALAEVAVKGDEQAIRSVLPCLDDECSRICHQSETELLGSSRCAAVEAMCLVADRGDERIVRALRSRLAHNCADVRRVAGEALVELVDTGDRLATEAVSTMLLECEDGTLRCEALKLLGKISQIGNGCALRCACICLQDTTNAVRHAAVALLTAMAGRGDESLIAVVSMCLMHPDTGVRCAAVDVLTELAARGDGRLVALAAVRLLNRPEASVRSMAHEVLQEAVEHGAAGDAGTIAAVRSQLDNSDAGVRRAAVMALAEVAQHGDEASIAALEVCSKDSDADVRMASVAALLKLTEEGDPRALTALRLSA